MRPESHPAGALITPHPATAPSPLTAPAGFLWSRGTLAASALRWWEPRRIVYNLVLATVTAIELASAWPRSWERLSIDTGLQIFLLSVLANVFYSAAYLPDLMFQFGAGESGLRLGRRIVFLVGILFAATLARFVARDLFGG